MQINKALSIAGLAVTAIALLAMYFYSFCFVRVYQQPAAADGYQTQSISIGDQNIDVYVADTDAKKELGLAAFRNLEQNHGMIFPFSEIGKLIFWMKDMQFDIDIIWVRGGQVVDISNNVKSETGKSDADLKQYSPISAVDTVIEVNAGWCQKNAIQIGDKVRSDVGLEDTKSV